MQKIEVVVRITKDHCPPQEQTIFEWFDLMRNPTDALNRPDLEINLEHHRVFKHGTEVYMSRYEYGVLSLMAQHPGKLFTKEQIFGNRQISRRIKKHLWLSNRSWARDVHSFGILHSWGALAGKSCSAQASSIWLIAGAFRRTQSK